MAAWDQFHRLPGSSRRYVNDHGVEISRRQYQQMKAGMTNERHAATMQQIRPSPMRGYRQLVHKIAEQRGVRPGEVRTDREISELWRHFRDEQKRADRAGREVDRSSTGALARVLVAMGRRDPLWTHDVGDTPERGA